MTQNFSTVYQIRNTGSGQFLHPGQLYLSPVPIAPDSYRNWMAKIAPTCPDLTGWWLARTGLRQLADLAKVPGLESAWLRHQRFLLISAGHWPQLTETSEVRIVLKNCYV
jgi:hypothetical protein